MTPPPNPTPLAEEVAREIIAALDAWPWKRDPIPPGQDPREGATEIYSLSKERRRKLHELIAEALRAHADEAVREHVSHLERDENWTSYLQRMDELTAALREKEQEIERWRAEAAEEKLGYRCQKCGLVGGSVRSYPSGSGHISRWTCPYCAEAAEARASAGEKLAAALKEAAQMIRKHCGCGDWADDCVCADCEPSRAALARAAEEIGK
jgi:hypothetical protein